MQMSSTRQDHTTVNPKQLQGGFATSKHCRKLGLGPLRSMLRATRPECKSSLVVVHIHTQLRFFFLLFFPSGLFVTRILRSICRWMRAAGTETLQTPAGRSWRPKMARHNRSEENQTKKQWKACWAGSESERRVPR